MVTQKGDNTFVVGIHGNFDDAQTGVKKIFADKEVEAEIIDDNYKSPIAEKYRWQTWAKDDEGMTGDELIDFINNGKSEQGNNTFEASPGGAPCNVLAMLTRLGKKCAFIGKVGDDIFGRRLKCELDKLHIDTKSLKLDEKVRTTLAFVENDANEKKLATLVHLSL